MQINVIVHPGSSQKKIILKENIYHIYIHCQPEKGKANKECIEILSKYFKVSKSEIKILAGTTNRKKTVRIEKSGSH